MHEYIDSMVIRLDMEGESPGKVQLPISKPIDDSEPASAAEGTSSLQDLELNKLSKTIS